MTEVIAIIGGGAAGCFAAANMARKEGREVVLFEKTGKILQKVKVSGGGRCNLTHHLFDIPELLKKYPRGQNLLRKTLYEFGPEDTIEWFESRSVKTKTEADGRMFPITDSSQTIIDALMAEMARKQVRILYHKGIERIEKTGEGFTLHFTDGTSTQASKVVIACGGFPKPEQYKWIMALGHSIEEPVPSLFTFNLPKHPITELMGVAVEKVTVKIAGTKIVQQGPIMITHWGLSGPAVLKTSAWAARELHKTGYDFHALVNWLDETTEQELKEQFASIRKDQGGTLMHSRNPFGLPKRLWEFLLNQSSIHEQIRWGELSSASQNKLLQILIRTDFHVSGKTTFKEEFVTAGGVKLSEVNPKTMESRIVPGIYFAGEILDVDGVTGGFNFQQAWASGFIVAKSVGF